MAAYFDAQFELHLRDLTRPRARPFLHGRVFVFNEMTFLRGLLLVTITFSDKANCQYAVYYAVFSNVLEFDSFYFLNTKKAGSFNLLSAFHFELHLLQRVTRLPF